jgi:hypothetical protein
MYNFKAYFWNETVYINEKHQYSTNEILKLYLNFDSAKLDGGFAGHI